MDVRVDPAIVAGRLDDVRQRLQSLGRSDVSIVAVTKSMPVEAWYAATLVGCDAIGENYAQEIHSKHRLCNRSVAPIHFIGRLQTNKIKALMPLVDLWQSVDREATIDGLARAANTSETRIRPQILIQVNTSGEATKSGCRPADADRLVDRARTSGLDVRGLMTIGPLEDDDRARRAGFTLLRQLVDECALEICSMGMSADFEEAVGCGSTMIRLGTALFGARA